MDLQSISQSMMIEYIGEQKYLELFKSINDALDYIDEKYNHYFIIFEDNKAIACCILVGIENNLFYIIMDQYQLKGVENIIIDYMEIEITGIIKVPILSTDIAAQRIFEHRGYRLKSIKSSYSFYSKIKNDENNHFCTEMIRNEGCILLLTNNRNGVKLYDKLKNVEEKVVLYSKRINKELIEGLKPQFIISYNYSYIITDDVINIIPNRIINMHISLLPWNRGASPNFWSFIDNTPKGVTIHKIDKGLDTGEIIVQKQLEFDEEIETFSSSYELLNSEIMNLLLKNWSDIKTGKYYCKKINLEGTYHSIKDFNQFTEQFPVDWNETIYNYKSKYQL